MSVGEKLLVIAYQKKDEMIANMLKKYVETNDDLNDGKIVGTEDGTVAVVKWEEKVWKSNRETGKGDAEKTLLINKVDGYEALEPIIDVKFNKFGVKYGFAGKLALLIADSQYLADPATLEAFKAELKEGDCLPKKLNFGQGFLKYVGGSGLIGYGIASALLTGLGPIALAALLIGGGAGLLGNEDLKDIDKIEQAQLLYGISHLYRDDLDKFMKS
jgi:hypothetical protein